MASATSGHAECLACDRASWVDYAGFRWINPTVEAGIERQVALADTPPLAAAEDTVDSTRQLIAILEEEEQSGRKHPLIRATMRCFWPQLMAMQTLKITSFLLGLMSPFVLQQVLVFQEAQENGKSLARSVVTTGFLAVGAYIFLAVFMLFYNQLLSLYQARLDLRMGNALRGAVVARGVDGKTRSPGEDQKARGDAAIYNVISYDVGGSIAIIWVILAVWLVPIQLATAFAALFSQVAWAVVPGLITIIIVKSADFYMLYWDGVYRDRLFFAKDERLACCGEGFMQIRTLQMLAWTSPHQDEINEAREKELKMQWARLWLTKMPAALDYGLTALVTLITLGYYVYTTGAKLEASLALPVISLISALIGPIANFPTWMNQYKIWRSCYDRTTRFMGFGVRPMPPASAEHSGRDNQSSETIAVALEGCTFSWEQSARSSPSEDADVDVEASLRQPLLRDAPVSSYGASGNPTPSSFELCNISLKLKAGEHLVVVGEEAQGKSSLLLALLGEMPLKAGSFSGASSSSMIRGLPSNTAVARLQLAEGLRQQGIAFAAQEAWLFAGTIRSNVLFGLPFEEQLYEEVLKACELKTDLVTMPSDDLTEITSGGTTLSGGQRARVSIARAVYSAVLESRRRQEASVVLLDEPFCALDKTVAHQVCHALLSQDGLLRQCAVIIAAANPWWLPALETPGPAPGLLVLRGGRSVAQGSLSELRSRDLPELRGLAPAPAPEQPVNDVPMSNPQDDEVEENEQEGYDEPAEDGNRPPASTTRPAASTTQKPRQASEAVTQTPLSEEQTQKGVLMSKEGREEGHVKWSTYYSYLEAVGFGNLALLVFALMGIMLFQNFCNLWIVYWTAEKKEDDFMYQFMKVLGITAPTQPNDLLKVYAVLIAFFFASNISGHAMEIIGGFRAARKIFAEALHGTFARPFRWWDANPQGRVLNRFSSDVQVMDDAVTNILGVIIGAVLYFFGHLTVLTLTNPASLLLLPVVATLMEYFAKFYRITVREIQRIYLASTSDVFQEMTEAIVGGVSLRAYGMKTEVLSRCLVTIDDNARASFAKTTLGNWVGLRMSYVGLLLTTTNTLYPVFQYFGILSPKSAALVGFSMTYSSDIVGIIQQFIMNFSEMEMQLISIERLREYANKNNGEAVQALSSTSYIHSAGGLSLQNVKVTYREGLVPALSDVTIDFRPGEAVAVVGRTGAGKSSLLLSILQLVPYTGSIEVGGHKLKGVMDQETAQLVAIVPQQPVLFAGSLRWNLDPTKRFTDSELWEALAAVGLKDTCASPHGLSIDISASSKASSRPDQLALSQGQRQLLCAARALLRKPAVALLDEVTASLSPEAAASTVEIMLKHFKTSGSTTLLVTHQDDLASSCDRIVRIAGGRIVGDDVLTR